MNKLVFFFLANNTYANTSEKVNPIERAQVKPRSVLIYVRFHEEKKYRNNAHAVKIKHKRKHKRTTNARNEQRKHFLVAS